MSKIIITPLGTISPYPKEYKNCPGFLVEYNDKKILLDCGNGITRLLDLKKDIKNLTVIITHFHKDHFGDIGSIQYASYTYHNLGLLDNKVKIYLPKKDYLYNKKSIIKTKESYSEYYDIVNNSILLIDDLKITFHNNYSHSIETYMLKLENNNSKVVYTSDIGIINLEDRINFCNNSDLLICESSYLQKHLTNNKSHLTAKDAAVLANLSNSKELLLTHFWPEEDIFLYKKEAKEYFDNTSLAQEGKKLVLK